MTYQHEDIARAFLSMRLPERDMYLHEDSAYREHMVNQIMHFPAFALPSLEHATVICGFVHAFCVGTAWMVVSKDFYRTAYRVLPQQRQICDGIYRALKVQRMDIEVETGRSEAEKYAEKLGFEFEGVKRRAGADARDLSIYIWPKERKVPWEE